MEIEIVEATLDLKPVVLNLALYYIHDFTEFVGFRCPDNGLFRTDIWDKYWTKPGHWAFLLRHDGEPAGFVMVGQEGSQPQTQFDMGEFFILRKFRRRGLGQQVAFSIFGRFPGRWEVRQLVENKPAIAFWRKVIHRYTAGQCQELPNPIQHGHFIEVVQTFDNTQLTQRTLSTPCFKQPHALD